MIIERPELSQALETSGNWSLVYGRRKTGKTFLVKNFLSYSSYYFVKRDLTILKGESNQSISYETLLELLDRDLEQGKTVVIDEFHRLGQDFFDRLHAKDKKGKLILISSTLFMSKKLLKENSPLLGTLSEFQVNLLSLSNILPALADRDLNNKEKLELALLLREPIAIDYINHDSHPTFSQVLLTSLRTLPGFVGEIFTEEDRKLSQRYEGILRSVASGRSVSGEIADYLHAHNLIEKNDPSLIQQYLTNLVDFGLLKKVKIYGKRKQRYKHVSPLLRLFYYGDEHYNITETRPSEREIGRIVDELIPHIVEDEVRTRLADKHDLQEAMMETPDYDIDACLLRFKSPELVAEVKWKSNIGNSDIKDAERKLKEVDCDRKLLFVPDKRGLESEQLRIIDVNDL